MDRPTLRRAAQSLLLANDRGGYTVPAPKLYPHQWNWDSAFVAIGFARFDPRRAASEIEMLLRGQWDDGLIPHIIFNPQAEHYEPSPRTWRTEGVPGSPKQARASSITQPPVAATAARIVLERSGGDKVVEASLRRLVPGLERWHDWWLDTRDPLGWGVACVVHPWESGMDNAPRWDAAMKRIDPGKVEYKRMDNTIIDPSQRPTRYDYDRYFFIVQERARLKFAPPTPQTEPLLVADVAITSILARAEEDLAALQQMLGMPSSRAQARREKIVKGLQNRLLDRDRARYRDYDVKADAPVRVEHLAGFMPLFAGVVPPDIAARMVADLRDPALYGSEWPLPTVPLNDPECEPKRYWRGPAWVNMNWMFIDGLRRAGFRDEAARLRERTLELVQRAGFREYFHPGTGEGLGAEDFCWTAALALDLLD